MLIRGFMAFSLILLVSLFSNTGSAGGNATKGKKVFKKCKACHAVKAGKNKTGPSLAGIVGKKAGSVSGYKKYKGLKNADWVWDEANLDGWLKNPKKWLKAKNGKKSAMVYKLKKAKDRANVIAYLKTKK
ncbi:MAG: c-type cytochrome [Pseudomonadota bacterium]|nr:c-type cytochrome [Pseudomonadota bacterium]